jgi:hypothetical protein
MLHAVVYLPTMLLGVISLFILARGRQRRATEALVNAQQAND